MSEWDDLASEEQPTKPKTRRRNDVPKIKKHVSLTPETVDKIKELSKEHSVSFSAMLESLALIGAGDDQLMALFPVMNESLRRMVESNYNRMSKLSAAASLHATEAKLWSTFTARLVLKMIDHKHIADLDYMVLDEEEEVEAIVRKYKRLIRADAWHKLKNSTLSVDELYIQLEKLEYENRLLRARQNAQK